jgi:hypothetical protein
LRAFQLRAAHSGKNAAVVGGSLANGAAIVQKTPNSLNSQGWVALPFGSASIMVNVNSNKVLDVAGGSTANGAGLVQHDFGPTVSQVESQVWFLLPFGDAQAVFVNYKSGLVMDVSGGSGADDVPLIQWPWKGRANQVWTGVAVGGVG